MTPAERRDISNGIWLCQTCGRLVDRDDSRYKIGQLRTWKQMAEASAKRQLGVPQGPGGRVAVLEKTLTGHTNFVWDVLVTPDARYAISASNDQTAAMWDLATGNRMCVYVGATSEVCSVSLSPSGGVLAGGCFDGSVLMWDVSQPDPITRIHHGSGDAKVAWCAGDLITAGQDGTIRKWSASGSLQSERIGHSTAILKIAVAGDGMIATASEGGSVRTWTSNLEGPLAEIVGHSGRMNSIAVAERCGLAATGCEDGTVKIWQLADGSLRGTLSGHEMEVWRVAVDCDERWVASGSGDNTVWLWDLATGEPLDTFTHDDCVAAIAFSPDGRRLVVGCDNAKIYVYGLEEDTISVEP